MPVANLLKLVMHWTGYGEEGTLSWHFVGNAGSHSPSELAAAAGNAVHQWETERTPSSKTGFCALLEPDQSVDSVTLYEYASSAGPATALGEHSVTGWAGTSGAVGGPLACALVASIKTALAGPSYRGRQYFPAHALNVSGANMLYTSTQADAVALLAASMGPEAAEGISESLSISTLEWAVYSPTKGLATVVTNLSVDNKPDTQRRREAQLAPSYTAVVNPVG
jgi:hypothetical protein